MVLVLVLWLALIFTGFTILAPLDGTVATVLFVWVLSRSTA